MTDFPEPEPEDMIARKFRGCLLDTPPTFILLSNIRRDLLT
jgi:hypothetical protein